MELSERINKAKSNDLALKIEADRKEKEEIESLCKKIEALTPRIKKLITTANDLIKAGFYSFIETDEWGKGGFRSEGWAHHIGFIVDGCKWENNLYIKYMGKINGGACGDHDFRTNGNETFMTVGWYKPERDYSRPIKKSDAEEFLKKFDDFEARFYSELEKFLAKKGA